MARSLYQRKDALAMIGFDERFFRLWDYYLAYCEVGFRMNATDVTLFKISKV